MASAFCKKRCGYLRSYVRPFYADNISAGPDEVRRCWIPIITARSERITQIGVFQTFGNNRVVHHVTMHLPMATSLYIDSGAHAFMNISPRKASPVVIMAHMIRASLLATATVTSLAGFRARSATIQSLR
jgi:hypothetical protein